jgi:hypothetical protein
MIVSRPTGAPPVPYRGPIDTAYRWFFRLITDDPQVRTLVKGVEEVAGPIDLAAVLARPKATPWLYVALQSGTPEVIGSGAGGTPQLATDLEISLAVILSGTDPSDGLRTWDAITAAVFQGYRADDRLRRMWDAGVSGVRPAQGPASLLSDPEGRERRSALLGSFRILI